MRRMVRFEKQTSLIAYDLNRKLVQNALGEEKQSGVMLTLSDLFVLKIPLQRSSC